jgi:hypothetical protein
MGTKLRPFPSYSPGRLLSTSRPVLGSPSPFPPGHVGGRTDATSERRTYRTNGHGNETENPVVDRVLGEGRIGMRRRPAPPEPCIQLFKCLHEKRERSESVCIIPPPHTKAPPTRGRLEGRLEAEEQAREFCCLARLQWRQPGWGHVPWIEPWACPARQSWGGF